MSKHLLIQLQKQKQKLAIITIVRLHCLVYFFIIGCLFSTTVIPVRAQVSEEWAKRYSRSLTYEAVTATDMALDAQGNVFVVGSSGSDVVTVKYSQDGVQQWIKRFDEANNGYSVAGLIAVDKGGNVYVTATTPYNDYIYYSDNITTVKYTTDGSEVWRGGYYFDYGASPKDMVVDATGNVYIIGTQDGGKYAIVNNAYTYKLNATGTFAWIRYSTSGIHYDQFTLAAITVDNSGNVYVAGVGTGDYSDYEEFNNEPSSDLITTKYNANGDILWKSRYNSPNNGQDGASDIAVDASGNVFVIGGSNGDYITVKYNINGMQQWVKTYNNTLYNGNDYAVATALDALGNLYVTGSSEGGNTGMDYATLKYTTSGVQQWVSRYNHTSNGADNPIHIVVDGSGNAYVVGISTDNTTNYATIKYNANGIQQWVTRYNTSNPNSSHHPLGIGIDGNGNVYIAGNSVDSGIKSTTIKYNSNGSEQWVKKLEKVTLELEDDKATAMVVDGSGNVYITGSTIGRGTRADFTTIKYSPNGAELWTKHYSAAGDDYATAIAVDASGNVYVTGSSFACPENYYPCEYNTSYDYYSNYTTVKYSPEGIEQWVKQYDSDSYFNDQATSIAIDGSGNIYVTGSAYGANSSTISEDFGTIKYAPDGTELWVQRYHNQFSDGSNDKATGIAIDVQGEVYVIGTSNGGGMGQDFATAKYSSDGRLLWSRIYNGPGNGDDQPVSIKVDASGSVYVAGSSAGSGTGQDYALVKYATSGTQSWVKRYHNGIYDLAKGLAVDGCGGVYLTGVSRNSNNGLVYRTLKYNTAGTMQWIKSYGDGSYPGVHENVAIAIDAACNVYIGGSDNLTTKARYVITKYSSTGTQLWQHSHQSGANSKDQAVAIAVNGTGNIYVAGTSKVDIAGSYTDYLTLKLNQNQSSLPVPWKNGDIGTVALTGSASYTNGVFTVKSGGFDFYKAPDSFHYLYQPFTGNATIVAKVESMGNTNANALAGLMIREDLTATSSFVAVATNPSNTNFMYRQGAGTPGYKSVPGTAPRWIKLSRNGNNFTSFYSADGVSWMQIGTITITMGSNIYVGMALTSQNNTLLNTATFSNVSVGTTPTAPTCTASGTILREYWANVTGSAVSAIPVNTAPSSSTQLSSFEAPSSVGDNYGQRIRGYICPPATGNYTFYIASDDYSELWLSLTDNPAAKQKIASVTGWTSSRQWTKFASQKSVAIYLEIGKKYYIEALHKESTGGDNLAVAWQIPASSTITLIPGSVLSPFIPTTPTCSASGTILREYWGNVTGTTVGTIPVSTKPTSTTQLSSFEAPTNIGDNYGQRIRGYICPPVTGSYTFYIASDDHSELWLSSTDNPATKQKIASVTGYTSSRQWTKFASQKSLSIYLEKDKRYYVEALHKEGAGGDNLAVAWQTPILSTITVIPGSVLSPVASTTAKVASEEQSTQTLLVSAVYPNPFDNKLTLTVKDLEGKIRISLLDIVGKQYYQKEYQISLEQTELEIDFISINLKAGLHLLKLETETGQSKVFKVFKR
ncbi:SBBP repeat-containing protein [Rhodocytophaga aerolata]|uniref:SBBP repeat-containing protein n=1 Tax=Rhodocytophaga aerolata TaxID=455078 RepID=A0ABT8RIR0_9BACT|nr:SBBP repeat-containing protein [Rhodocytophaga aerolata]MDO1451601.1 SBBP repeat-containing protein [Rhodocytophaga aerolata]